MKQLDKKTSIDTVRLAIFVVVTTIATALLAVTIGNISFNATTKYRAVFTDPCAHPALVCIGHRDESDALQGNRGDNYIGWTCHVCKARIGFIVNWERAR